MTAVQNSTTVQEHLHLVVLFDFVIDLTFPHLVWEMAPSWVADVMRMGKGGH